MTDLWNDERAREEYVDLDRDSYVGSGRTPAGIGNGLYGERAGDGDGLGKNTSRGDESFDLSGIGNSQDRGGSRDLSLSSGTTLRVDDGMSGSSNVFGRVIEEDIFAGDGFLEESHRGRSGLGYARRPDVVGIAVETSAVSSTPTLEDVGTRRDVIPLGYGASWVVTFRFLRLDGMAVTILG